VNRTRSPWTRLLGIAVIIVLFATACGAASTPATLPAAPTAAAGPTKVPAPAPAAGSLLINGAGATFPYPLYSAWFYQYAFVNPSVKFNYQSIGSGGGISQITAKTVDFAGSDAILSDAQYKAVAPAQLQMFPSVAGGVVMIYNVKELVGKDPIVLDGPAIANIFLGTISKWNDPAIAALNPSVTLPAKDIVVVHRSDGSGTTFMFTDFLSKVSSTWKDKVGNATSVNWPAGLGGKGSDGVAGTVSQQDGTIAYIELTYALQNKLQYAKMKNSSGAIVEASPASVAAALADFGSAMTDALTISTVNAPGAPSYPIAGYTYLIVYTDQQNCTKGKAVLDFIRWAVSDAGSKYATDLSYVPLPANVRTLVLNKLGTITCQGKPMQ
jgi:phosphate transport system substrate-binding protein